MCAPTHLPCKRKSGSGPGAGCKLTPAHSVGGERWTHRSSVWPSRRDADNLPARVWAAMVCSSSGCFLGVGAGSISNRLFETPDWRLVRCLACNLGKWTCAVRHVRVHVALGWCLPHAARLTVWKLDLGAERTGTSPSTAERGHPPTSLTLGGLLPISPPPHTGVSDIPVSAVLELAAEGRCLRRTPRGHLGRVQNGCGCVVDDNDEETRHTS